MIQNAIKILTLGFFISMITGFVMYRSGYFDSEKTSYSLHTSPNGGELNAEIDQDTTKTPQINQNNKNDHAPVMPSSKSIAPVFDLEKYEQEKRKERFMSSSKSGVPIFDLDVNSESLKKDMKRAILPSSKSMLHPIEIKPKELKLDEMHLSSSKSMLYPIEIKQTANQIEDEKREAFRQQPELDPNDSSANIDSEAQESETIKKGKRKTTSDTKSTPINWRAIWIGVLGILFVAIGSIVYFKRRSK